MTVSEEAPAGAGGFDAATGLGDPVADRLLGMIAALAGELFTCKVELEDLRQRLAAEGVLADVGTGERPNGLPASLRAWISAEASEFAKHVLDPLSARPGERLFRFGLTPED